MNAVNSRQNARTGLWRQLPKAAAAVILIATVSSCSAPVPDDGSGADRTETFDFSGTELTVENDYAEIDVERGQQGEVVVREFRTVFGTSASEPEWTLVDGALDLGTPCASTIGVCEVRYSVSVPEGTTVTPMETVENAR